MLVKERVQIHMNNDQSAKCYLPISMNNDFSGKCTVKVCSVFLCMVETVLGEETGAVSILSC